MSELTLDAAEEAKDDAQGSGRSNEAGIPDDQRVDYDNETVAEGSGHARAMVTFSHIARINIQDYGNDDNLLAMEQNLEGAGRYGYDLELTLANPELVEGQVWKETDTEWPDYKVIGDPEADSNGYELREDIIKDEDGNPVDTEIKGIGGLGSTSWDGQPLEDGFDADYFQVSISSRRASRILGALDTAGQWFRTKEGDVAEGIMETPPNFGTEVYDSDEDGYPRLVGYPELRADMVGQKGAITFTWGDSNASGNRAKEVDVFRVTDDGLEALIPLTPGDGAYALPEYPRSGNTMWDDAEAAGGSADEGDVGADTEPESGLGLDDASEALADSSGETDDSEADEGNENSSDGVESSESEEDPTVGYDDLNDDAQAFCDDAVKAIEAKDLSSITALDDYEERVATFDGTVNVSTDQLAEVIDGQAGV